jgi:transcriptional regulator with XRE-family HTH domain
VSQYAQAKRTGLSKQAISKLEFGEHEPGWATLQLLSVALGVSCESFVNQELVENVVPLEPLELKKLRKPRGQK